MRYYRVIGKFSSDDLHKKAEWVASLMVAAEPTAKKIGCSPEAVIAQAALETGWGKSAIGHNLFGIKVGKGWTGKRQLVTTREVIGGQSIIIQDWFRDYDSAAESIADHFDFLVRNTRYAAAGVFDPDDTKSDEEYFAALKRAGYATDPNYVAMLTAVLQTVKWFVSKMEVVAEGKAPPPRLERLLLVGCSDGPDIMAVQALLKVPATSKFDVVTDAAVRQFQASSGLKDVDGIVGPLTWAKLQLLASAQGTGAAAPTTVQ